MKQKVKVKVKLLSRVRLCDPMDHSPPGSSVHWVLQARIVEWDAISSFASLRTQWIVLGPCGVRKHQVC